MTSAPPSPRDDSLDVARGIAIILVVAGHVLRGLFAAKLVAATGLWSWLDQVLYLTHLPVFAFAIGLLMPRSVERSGRAPYLRRRLWLLAYLFGVWTLIEGAFEIMTSRLKNTPVSWERVLELWRPLGHLWFLPALIVATVLVVAARPWRRTLSSLVGTGLVVALGISAWGWEPTWFGLGGLALLVFYAAGAFVGHDRFHALARRTTTAPLAVVATIGIGLVLVLPALTQVIPPTVGSERDLGGIALGILCSCAAVAGVMALSVLLARIRPGAPLATLGRLSLQVYLAHIIFAAGTRVVLARLGVVQPAVHLVAGTVAGIAGALLLERLTRSVPWLFKPPSSRTGNDSSSPPTPREPRPTDHAGS